MRNVFICDRKCPALKDFLSLESQLPKTFLRLPAPEPELTGGRHDAAVTSAMGSRLHAGGQLREACTEKATLVRAEVQ